VQIRLENGLTGFLPIKCLSDPEVKTPEERFRPEQTIHCRITKINVEKLSVEATVPVQALPVPLPSAPSTSSRPNSSDRSRSPLPRAHSPISPTPVPAWYHNLVADQPSIFNPVLWESRTRCQDYLKTGRCMRPRFLCPFTHGNVPSNDARSRFFEIEQYYEAAGASSSHS
jgi:hypothetical protein